MDIGGHQLSESDVAAKLAHRGRGLLKLEQRVGPVCRQIEQRLIDAKAEKLRLLEIGCGYGVALMELRRRFADRIELTGTNRERLHGDTYAMLTAASLRNISDTPELHSVALPTIVYGDAANGLPFDDCSFDVVVSQMCFQHVDDKVLLLREAARVIKENGIAMIHTPFDLAEMPAPYAVLLEIWEHGAPVTFRDYLAGCKGHVGLQLGYHSCVHLSHCTDFGADLELLYAIKLKRISPNWDGVKSTYGRRH